MSVSADAGDEKGLHISDADSIVLIDSNDQQWKSSGPAAKVERKRFFRNGPPESGRVTSLVKYRPNASFPQHPHPEGEEIFVLEGVFIDKRGDHGPGTFLLNPEGFFHAPRTNEGGNLIYVRLRQYPGEERPQKAIDTNNMDWDSDGKKELFSSDSFPDKQYFQKWGKNEKIKSITSPELGFELFVVSGSFSSSAGAHPTHSFLRLPPGEVLENIEVEGEEVVVLVKENGRPTWLPVPEIKQQ
mmetsp:Transcript_24606/g.38358  ORF Transcript_24606/g.38358 Transcript_24606/m.38358 type:complete len:243 (-) Transcript_24606:48-776(-)